MSGASTESPPPNNKFKECESIALKDTVWQIGTGLKKFSQEEAEKIITSHGGTIYKDPSIRATHELKYAKDTYAFIGPGKATIFEPGFLSYVRGQVMFKRIKPRDVAHHQSLHKLAFIFTGTMPWLQKEEYKELVQEFGGRLQKKVNVNTNYVVVGYKDVPETVMRVVKELEIKTLDEDGFIELLQTRKPPGLKDFRVDMGGEEKEEVSVDSRDVEMQSEEKAAEEKKIDGEVDGKKAANAEQVPDVEDVEMPDEDKVLDKGKAMEKKVTGKPKKKAAAIEKKSAAEAKKDTEKQKTPAKKTAGGKKSDGGKTNAKVEKEQGSWSGRLRSRGAASGESNTALK